MALGIKFDVFEQWPRVHTPQLEYRGKIVV